MSMHSIREVNMAVRRIIRTLISALFIALLLAGCTGIQGSGNLVREARSVSGFTAIELAEAGEVTIEQTGSESLTISAEDNLLPLLTSQVVNGRLILDSRRNTLVRPTRPITYRVTVKELSQITISGSGAIDVPDLSGEKLIVVISAAGNVKIAGSVASQEIEISGSGAYTAPDLDSQVAKVDISGSGTAVVKANQRLTAVVSGNGSVEYTGDAVVDSQITGSGRVSKR
jgi:hypothetical protein